MGKDEKVENFEVKYLVEKISRISMQLSSMQDNFLSLTKDQREAMDRLKELDPEEAKKFKPVENVTKS